jgi:hypothetical protein
MSDTSFVVLAVSFARTARTATTTALAQSRAGWWPCSAAPSRHQEFLARSVSSADERVLSSASVPVVTASSRDAARRARCLPG